jgi:hypothetical protein
MQDGREETPDQMMEVRQSGLCHTLVLMPAQVVRWEADAIITDVTKVWLDLHRALTGKIAFLKENTGS